MEKSTNTDHLKYIYELHNDMQTRHLILLYEGEFTQEITKSVLEMAERNMDHFGEESNIKRKVFNIMVECLQNISKHATSMKDLKHPKTGIFLIGKFNGSYIISSGNFIANDKVDDLNSRLEKINSLDKDGLKAIHKEFLSNAKNTKKHSPGLGLIDIARKSGQKIEYSIDTINDKISYFSLHAKRPKYVE